GGALVAALGPAIFDRDGAALEPAQFAQPLQKGVGPLARGQSRARAHEPDGRQLCLLCPRRRGPSGSRGPKVGDELAPLHAITSSFDHVIRAQQESLRDCHSSTSSARPRSVSGNVSPSALAVFMLMISSTLVTCCTGRSEGFSPLRIRPV